MRSLLSSAAGIAGRIEKGLCFSFMILMALLPVADVLLRPFNIAIPFSRQFLVRLFLLTGLFAAMLTTKTNEHIAISITQYIKNKKLKSVLSFITGLFAVFVMAVLFWDSISFIKHSFSGRTVASIPEGIFALAMPIIYIVMTVRFAIHSSGAIDRASSGSGLKWIPFLVILLGFAAALPAISKIVWGFEEPAFVTTLMNFLYDGAFYAKTPIIFLLIAAALAGTPVIAIIGGIALVMLQAAGGEPEAVPIQIYSAHTDVDLIAIPLFTLTGFFLSESRAGERLVAAFRSLFSWMPGGMIIATVIICAFFTSFTGASGVTILALGGILFTILNEKLGYPEKFTIGLLTSVGCIGLLFPPSLPIILVGSSTNSILFFMGETVRYNIIDFFLGGIVPGIILVLVMIIFGIIASVRVKIPITPFNIKEAAAALKGSILEILLPFILIAGYFSGILTLVEVSAVSVLYVFIIEVIINRDIALKDVPRVFLKAVPIIGGILAILAMSKALSYAIIDTEAPIRFANWMHNTVESKYVFLLLLNLALLLLGCVMDIFSAILVLFPMVVPLGQAYGVDPIHLGIIFIINLEVGFLTPPIGINLFLSSYRFKKPFTQICRFVLPFMAVQLLVVFMVTYIPALSTFLVELFK